MGSSERSSADALPSPGAIAAAQYVCGMRCQFADPWVPSWSQTRWVATLLESMGITSVLEAHGTFMRIFGAIAGGKVFSGIGEYELQSAENLKLASQNAEHDLQGNRTASFYIRATIDTVSLWSAVASGGLTLLTKGGATAAPVIVRRSTGIELAGQRGRLGTPVDAREALIQRMVIADDGAISPWVPGCRPTEFMWSREMAEGLDDLTSILGPAKTRGGFPAYRDFQQRAAEHTARASRVAGRHRDDPGGFGLERGSGYTAWAETGIDYKHLRLANRRGVPAVPRSSEWDEAAAHYQRTGNIPTRPTGGPPAKTTLHLDPDRSDGVWVHPAPNDASYASIDEAYRGALTAPNEAKALDWIARFYYRVARTMPLERGSAGPRSPTGVRETPVSTVQARGARGSRHAGAGWWGLVGLGALAGVLRALDAVAAGPGIMLGA